MEIKKVNITDQDFNRLIRILDNTISNFNSDIQSTEKNEYHAFNSVSDLTDAFVAYSFEEAIGCVATKLESQAYSDGYKRIVVETGKNNSDAIRLYTKMNYQLIDNYPPYDELSNSVCMSKNLL